MIDHGPTATKALRAGASFLELAMIVSPIIAIMVPVLIQPFHFSGSNSPAGFVVWFTHISWWESELIALSFFVVFGVLWLILRHHHGARILEAIPPKGRTAAEMMPPL